MDGAPVEAALLKEADRLVGGEDAFLSIDDTASPKKDDPDAPMLSAQLTEGIRVEVGGGRVIRRAALPASRPEQRR